VANAVRRSGSNADEVRIEQASSDTPAGDSTVTSTTEPTSDVPASVESTTTTAAPSTTTTAAPTSTTRPPTTTTTVAPGSSEVVIHGGGVSYMTGGCSVSSQEWARVAGCPDSPRTDLDFTFDAGRYPKGSEFRHDANVSVYSDSTYCLRLFDLDRNAAVAGSERCWSAPFVAVIPPPAGMACCATYPAPASLSGESGPMTFSGGRARYTIEARAFRTSTGEGCVYPVSCGGTLSRAKVLIEWG
jgi:hypothetical protein